MTLIMCLSQSALFLWRVACSQPPKAARLRLPGDPMPEQIFWDHAGRQAAKKQLSRRHAMAISFFAPRCMRVNRFPSHPCKVT